MSEGFTGETAEERLTRVLLTEHDGVYGLARALEEAQEEIVRLRALVGTYEFTAERGQDS